MSATVVRPVRCHAVHELAKPLDQQRARGASLLFTAGGLDLGGRPAWAPCARRVQHPV